MSMGQCPRGEPSQCWIFCKLRLWPTVETQFMHVETLFHAFVCEILGVSSLSSPGSAFHPWICQVPDNIWRVAASRALRLSISFPTFVWKKDEQKKWKRRVLKLLKARTVLPLPGWKGMKYLFSLSRYFTSILSCWELYSLTVTPLILAAKLCKWRSHTLWWVFFFKPWTWSAWFSGRRQVSHFHLPSSSSSSSWADRERLHRNASPWLRYS